jgi:molybdopterin-guanine dinucleotide biosynthesis protein A
MSMKANLSLAILAGGKSRRFGSPKFRARFMSQTLLEIMLQKALAISRDCMVIAGQAPISLQENIPVYTDIYPDCGPLGGLYTALYHSNHSLVAILPCDMPLLEPAVYTILMRNAAPKKPIVAVSDRGLEPLVSIWPVEDSLPVVAQNLTDKKFSFQKTLEELEAIPLDVRAYMVGYKPDLFKNINYPADLRQLELRTKDNHVIKEI